MSTTETKVTHTPGPWFVERAGRNPRVLAKPKGFKPTPENPVFVVTNNVYISPDKDEATANAHLIAAAPDMLEALELEQFLEELKATHDPRDIIRLLESRGDYESGHLSTEKLLEEYAVKAALARQNAIAKAKGGAA